MIQKPGQIFFSRFEKKNEENHWTYTSTYTLAIAAKKLFMESYPTDADWWKKWNVIELHGYEKPTLHFVEYPLFGVHPFPTERRRFCFYPYQRSIVELKILDPFILHHSFKLVPEKGFSGDPLNNPKDRTRWFACCDELYHGLEKHNLVDHPQASYESGWRELLNMKGVAIRNLPDENTPMSISKWKVEIVDGTQANFGDL